MKINDKVTSKSHPELGVMTVIYMDGNYHGAIVTVKSDTGIMIRGDSDMDDDDYDDLQVTEPCKYCSPEDALTHITEDHDQNYVAKLEECDECGSRSGEDCKPSCRWAYCPVCGLQNDQCAKWKGATNNG